MNSLKVFRAIAVGSLLTINLFGAISCSSERVYMNRALHLMEKYSVHSDSIHWKEVRRKTNKKIKNADGYDETHTILKDVLYFMGDKHARLVTPIPTSQRGFLSGEQREISKIELRVLKDSVLYIKIPYYYGSKKQLGEYISGIFTFKNENISNFYSGIIVDLRGNTGGNMWPMLIALNPILGNGVCGHFVARNGDFTSWKLLNGSVYVDDNLVMASENKINFRFNTNKIAVLLNRKTVSSGEATAIALKRMQNSKFFGSASAGYTTANSGFTLKDKARLYFSTSYFTDVNFNVYPEVTPDYQVEDAFNRALQWIHEAPN